MLTQKPNLGAIGESRVQRVPPEAPAVYDNAQVYDNAWVYDNAQVYDNAWVYGNAQVYGDATSDVPLYTIAEAQKRESACASEAMPDLSGRVQMRMAKASDADLNVAYRLMRLVDAIGDGYYPSDEEGAPTFFDDDWEHLQFLHRQIAESSGGIHRVVGAAGILLDQKNNLIDPEEDCIELSPDMKEAIKAKEELDKIKAERDSLLTILVKIVTETMDYPPERPSSAESWIPRELVSEAQAAIMAVRGHPVPTYKDLAAEQIEKA